MGKHVASRESNVTDREEYCQVVSNAAFTLDTHEKHLITRGCMLMGIRNAFHSTPTNRLEISGLYCKCFPSKPETASRSHYAWVLENKWERF